MSVETWPSTLPESDAEISEKKLGAIHSPEDLQQFLEIYEEFQNEFQIANPEDPAIKKELVQMTLDEKILWRGMSPQDIFNLLEGDPIAISPYRYTQSESSTLSSEEDLQNATRSFNNAILHGADREQDLDFLAAVEFDASDFDVTETGTKMTQKFQEQGEVGLLPANKNLDVSINGTLYPEDINLVVFRFGREQDFRKLIYKRKVA